MEITTTTTDSDPRRTAAVNALAIVGFAALILIGIALAIWSARYVPIALNNLGTGAVSLSSIFTPADEEEPGLEVIDPGTSIPFEPIATSTATSTVVVANTPNPTGTTPVVAGPPRTITVPITVPPPAPHGRADLTVDITSVGYCTSDRPSSFRRASDIPDNENGGIQFTVRNAGTNVSGSWDFTYELPTSPALEKTVRNQRSLNPNDRIEYTLCFTEPRAGDNREIAVRVDTNRNVNESNENNNTDSVRVDIDS